MIKIVSWNVNGIRAVYKRGLVEKLNHLKADIICLQEIKAQKDQLPSVLANFKGYYSFFSTAQKKGYSGVVVYTRKKPIKVEKKLGFTQFDQEGRVLILTFPKFTLLNLYLPHGGRDKEKLDYKLSVYQYLLNYLSQYRDRPTILAGDFNIAHQEIDLARPKQNQNNIMFTPEERKQLDELIRLGFVDSFRQFKQNGGHYTWWPFYPLDARKRNLGWRLDYIFVSKALKPDLKNSLICPEIAGSDHCPITLEIF